MPVKAVTKKVPNKKLPAIKVACRKFAVKDVVMEEPGSNKAVVVKYIPDRVAVVD